MKVVMNANVAAVVVTYNRLNDLKKCIGAIRKQTYKGYDLVVVNNGGTDGTKEYLSSLNDVIVLNQSNSGDAGGFYAGMRFMMESSYEYLWLMDDDGIPDERQLEALMEHADSSLYLNALVLDVNNHDEFSFPPMNEITVGTIRQYDTYDKFVHPFNGTLFNRKLIEQIGYIKKEMFIWGDEKEYTYRAVSSCIIPLTIPAAVHYHPKEKGKKAYALPFLKSNFLMVLEKPKNLSHYYYRNLGYIDACYRTVLKSVKNVIVHSTYFIRTFQFGELSKFLKYYMRGRKDNYL